MFRRVVATSPTWITVPLRLVMAVIFVGHGAQKVLGSFGGKGLRAWVSVPAPFNFMRPAWLWLGAAAFAELLGGVSLFLGLLTRVGAFFLACTMFTAAATSWPNLFGIGRGMEYPMVLLGASLALLISGGGQASVDLALSSSSGRRR
jgi:putative oxidoreductase